MRSRNAELGRNSHSCPSQACQSQLQHTTTFKYTFEKTSFTNTSFEDPSGQEVTQEQKSLGKLSFWGLWNSDLFDFSLNPSELDPFMHLRKQDNSLHSFNSWKGFGDLKPYELRTWSEM